MTKVISTATSEPMEAGSTKSDATFPRAARLLSPQSFTAVFEKRSVRRGRFFHLHIGPENRHCSVDGSQENRNVSRIGIAVSKKLLKTAVHRNIVKRISRDIFRQVRSSLDGRDYVLRLAVKIDPKKMWQFRHDLAGDIRALLAGRTVRQWNSQSPMVMKE